MTRDEFVELHRHEIAGMVTDALTCGKSGAEAALFLRSIMKKIDMRLIAMYGQLRPEPKAPDAGNGNGTKQPQQPQQQRKTT